MDGQTTLAHFPAAIVTKAADLTEYEKLSLLSSYIYTLSTIILLFIAMLQFRHSRRDSSIRATIAILQEEANDANIKKTRSDFHDLIRAKPENLVGFFEDQKFEREREVLRSVANRYEYIAIAIKTKAMNLSTYLKLWKSSTIHDWYKMADFIQAARDWHNNQAIWNEFEWLKDQCEQPEKKFLFIFQRKRRYT